MSYALDARRARRVRPHSVHGLGCGCAMPMAGLGTLVEPDYTIWTPGERQAWLREINDQILAMNNDIIERRSRILAATGGQRFIDDFHRLKTGWLTFNSTASTWVSGAVAQAAAFVNEYNALETRYTALVGEAPTVARVSSERERPPSLAASANRNLMVWAVIGITGVVGIGYLLSNYAKIKMMSKLAMNRRRRRHR